MPTTFEQELAREQNATETAGKIKKRIKRFAEDKGFVVEETDTPMKVLSKLYTGTIATPTETINITSNGTVDVTNYANANVNVPSEEPTLGTKTITANGTYNASDDNFDGYSSVTVNVAGGSSKFASLVDKSITQVTAEDLSGATSIGEQAFYNCSNLTSIEIPSSVKSIRYDAFYGTPWLTNLQNTSYGIATASDGQTRFVIDVPTDITDDELDMTNVKVIADEAFKSCSNLTNIEIPSSVTSIGRYAFYDCRALKTVTFGDNSQLESIGDYAFYYCSNLTSIEIPSSVTSIGGWAFCDCSALETVTFEDTVTEWTVTREPTSKTITSQELQSPSTMATYLKRTYYSYTWTKKQSA